MLFAEKCKKKIYKKSDKNLDIFFFFSIIFVNKETIH